MRRTIRAGWTPWPRGWEGIEVDDAPQEVNGHGTFFAGDVIRVTATFSEPVRVDLSVGRPYVEIGIGVYYKQAFYAGKGGPSQIVFEYTVAAGDSDTDGLRFRVRIRDADIRDAAGHELLTPPASTPTTELRVDGSQAGGTDAAGPVIGSLAFAGAAQYDTDGDTVADTYGRGHVIEVAATFSEAVTVDTAGGRPTLALDVGGVTRQAAYASGTGTATLVFSYTVADRGRPIPTGCRVPAGSIALAGGDARRRRRATPRRSSYDALAPDAGRKVDATLGSVTLTGLAFAGVGAARCEPATARPRPTVRETPSRWR